MKKILIISFNQLNQEFWSQYINFNTVEVTFVHPDELVVELDKDLKYDRTIVDTYFNNHLTDKTRLSFLIANLMTINGLGQKTVLSPVDLDMHYIDLRVSRFSTEIVESLSFYGSLNISA